MAGCFYIKKKKIKLVLYKPIKILINICPDMVKL